MRGSDRAFHPILLAIVFVLQAALAYGLAPAALMRPMLVAALAATAVLGLLWLLIRDLRTAGLFATGLFLLVISHDPVIDLLVLARDALGGGAAMTGIVLAIFIPAALLALGLDQLRRGHLTPSVTRRATSALNLFSVVLLAVVVLPAVPSVPSWFDSPPSSPGPVGAADTPPDIYVMLLDGYPRADELERLFGIDNAPFLGQLRDHGFDVDAQSRTNYTYTSLTLTAMLSMDYVRVPASGVVTERALGNQLRAAMTSGPAFAALRGAGYQVAASAAGWEGTSLRRGVDRFLDRPELTDFERTLLARTWVLDLPLVQQDLLFDNLRSRIEGVLGDGAALATEERRQPLFAFIHVPAPHLPIAFEAGGAAAPYDSREYLAGGPLEFGLSDEEYARAYAANLAYLNDLVLETVDALQAGTRPPVIVVLSDHGYHDDSPVHAPTSLHNLFAAYTPGHPGLLADAPTTVNLLRQVLDTYTDAELGEPLPERFFTTTFSGPASNYELTLTEVTDP